MDENSCNWPIRLRAYLSESLVGCGPRGSAVTLYILHFATESWSVNIVDSGSCLAFCLETESIVIVIRKEKHETNQVQIIYRALTLGRYQVC